MLIERFSTNLWKLHLLPLIQSSWVKGKKFECPNCFPFFGHNRVRTGFQHCNFDKILGIFILMTGDKMVSHVAEVSTHLVVRFMISPPLTHGLVIGCGGGSHFHIVGPFTLWPSRVTDQYIYILGIQYEQYIDNQPLNKETFTLNWRWLKVNFCLFYFMIQSD